MATTSMVGQVAHRPAWLTIDLRLLEQNYLKLKSYLVASATSILAVVKANAYGHGAVAIAKRLEECGVTDFGVSSIDEGVRLRQGGIGGKILILGSAYPFSGAVALAQEYGLSLTISSVEAAVGAANLAQSAAKRLGAHIKIETGMSRIGAKPQTAASIAQTLSRSRWVKIEGVYTHFSSARDEEFTARQLAIFQEAVGHFKVLGIDPGVLHAANSTATVNQPMTQLDMVRSGLALYGGMDGFEPVMSLTCKVVFLKRVPKDTPVSYERTFVTAQESLIATLPVGYADGLPVRASGKAQVLINGERVSVTGLITMDMTMLDVTKVPGVHVGDEVTLLGVSGEKRILPQDWAHWSKGSVYELLCHMGGGRTPFIYRK
ncbi:MAG: alanine racemase [Elusimicrobiota bacterium]